MAVLPWTLPTRVILETSFARRRSLWMRAKGRSKRSATAVALKLSLIYVQLLFVCLFGGYRFAPPASGETMTAFE